MPTTVTSGLNIPLARDIIAFHFAFASRTPYNEVNTVKSQSYSVFATKWLPKHDSCFAWPLLCCACPLWLHRPIPTTGGAGAPRAAASGG
jgi:hypothetical protein